MRIRENFADIRKSEIKFYKPKFFIVSEGSRTEPRYFEKLNQSVISENVTIINLLRDYVDLGKSNPTFIIKLLKEFVRNNSLEISVSEFKKKILNWDHENPGKIDLDNVFIKLNDIYEDDNLMISYSDFNDLFMFLFKSEIIYDVTNNFKLYFESQDVTFSPVTDSLNMVIDRDKDNFYDYQYDEVKKFVSFQLKCCWNNKKY
jgi:hypothetical protein